MPDFVLDPWFFWTGLFLLWFPRSWMAKFPLSRTRTAERGTRSGLPGAEGLGVGQAVADPRNLLDFARAAVGGYAFWQQGFDFGVIRDPSLRGPFAAHLITLFFAMGVLLQMLRPSDSGNRRFYAPVLFSLGLLFSQYAIDLSVVLFSEGVGGLMRGALGVVIGVLVVLIMIAVSFLFETPYVFYLMLALAHTAVTAALTGIGNQRIFAMGWLGLFPVVVAFLFRAELTYEPDEVRRYSRTRRSAVARR